MNEKYKGPKFYQESDKDVFFGREEETKKLYYLVENSDYSVCYAESGEGKSSLINAGLSPMLRKNRFLPIRILFSDDVFLNDIDGKTLDNIVWKALENEIQTSNMLANSGFDNIALYPTTICEYDNDVCKKLGWKLRNFELRGNSFDKITPVIIFDQFEEVFTKAKDVRWIDTLFGWLECLFDDSMYAESSKNLHKNFKLLISMRSDYISELDYWSMDRYFIPSLKNNRYYLKSITKKGALEILGKLYPNQLEDLTTDEILRLAQLERTGNLNELEDNIPCISAMVLSLSLACIKEKPKEILKVFRKNQENVQNNYDNWILEFYYSLALKECHLKRAEQDILEMSLIDTNGYRKRISIDDSEISKIGDGVINNLIQKRILYKAGNFIEIAHDCLRGIIDKHNKERLYKTEDKLFFSWEFAVFAFLCVGCYFSVMYMFGATSRHSEDFTGGWIYIFKEIICDLKILVMLLFSVPLLILPHISFLKFENLLNLNNKNFIYPLYMVIIGWFSAWNIDNDILQSLFKVSPESIKVLCYIYMIVLTIFMGILYIPNLRIFPTKSNRNIIDKSTVKKTSQRNMDFLWFVFFLTLAFMLQISHKPISGSIVLILILLILSYSYIINILIENKKAKNICKIIGTFFICLLGKMVLQYCFLFFAFALIFICPIIMVMFCKITWLRRLKLTAYLASIYLLFFYILTNFTNPLLFLKGYDVRYIGSEGYILVENNNKEAVISRSGFSVFDLNIADSCISKTSAGLLRPTSIYKLPIRNSQAGLYKEPIMMLPIMVNDSISILRNPDFWGRLYSIQENGTQEQKLASKIFFDFIRAYSSSTNDLLDDRNIIQLYNDLEISLKKQSQLCETNDVIFYQQTLTKYLFVAIMRDAIIENRKSDALKMLTLLEFSILGNSHVYDGLKFTLNCNIKATNIQDSLNSGVKFKNIILRSDNMRSNEVHLVDKFWYDYFIVSTSIARAILSEYDNKYISDYTSSFDSIAISKSSNLEQGIDNNRKMLDLCNKMLVYIRNGNDSYLTKAVLNCTKQTTILLKNDAISSRHDWRSVLKYRFLRNLYQILPLQKLIVKSNNEIKEQDKKINDIFYNEAENEILEREKLFRELKDNLDTQISTYNFLKRIHSSLMKN